MNKVILILLILLGIYYFYSTQKVQEKYTQNVREENDERYQKYIYGIPFMGSVYNKPKVTLNTINSNQVSFPPQTTNFNQMNINEKYNIIPN